MYFKKLELIGFKSFFDKTTLYFEPGITCIVGPNGCGKSNLFDSIRWVLGEQSIKSLRGSNMEDVIFNGTDSKEPLGMAEVILTFDNSNRFFTVDHNEVSITRRVFRSGESEYFLNKTPVRLKDILDLLTGTGIGSESYSLVEQGKVDLILSAKPDDRRLVFDEASGITKYKLQKKEALKKLGETEQNLLRINDIINEVKRQIASLERQANKARKYKELFEELKLKEINLAILQKNQFLKVKDGIINQLNQIQSQENSLLNLIKEQESYVDNRNTELKNQQERIADIKNEILNLENLVLRNKQLLNFNQEKIDELAKDKKYLESQIVKTKNRIILDEEKLENFKKEYTSINKIIEEKNSLLKDRESKLSSISLSIKTSQEIITQAKRGILELATKLTHTKNEITDLTGKEQIYMARARRLEIEKVKVNEEKTAIENDLNNLTQELKNFEENLKQFNFKMTNKKEELEKESQSLNSINLDIANLEKQKLALSSHKEFLERLKTEYEDIAESMNAVIFLDRLPSQKVNSLVVKIKDQLNLNEEDKKIFEYTKLKLLGEAKPVDLDTQRINRKIEDVEQKLFALENTRREKEVYIKELNKAIEDLEGNLRNQELALANKRTFHQTVLEQFNKIKDELDIIVTELSGVALELSILKEKLSCSQSHLSSLEKEQKDLEDLILEEQNKITLNNSLKEELLVTITQVKTELDALSKRLESDQATLNILEDTYRQDEETLLNFQKQINEINIKQKHLDLEVEDLEKQIDEAKKDSENQNSFLKEVEDKYGEISKELTESIKKIESERKELDSLRNKLYQLQLENKDTEFKISSIKDRILQAYKVDLDTLADFPKEQDTNILSDQIQKLREKLGAYGTVSLLAIEEYDELKNRYDFLIQQQNDLILAKGSLHQAIQKINRTTKKMFLETFEKIRQEFRNYFRLLFNGGDAQIFLIDEQDPLESGIEIICRPPGKKLQNVLLLSGGEKALSAIALLFAIFKVKPSPFCVLDEIDAALDEANIDRFSRLLQEFAKNSQFIVITHNKRTITNADVMYGITMEESGISKIVSVKFADEENSKKIKETVDVAA